MYCFVYKKKYYHFTKNRFGRKHTRKNAFFEYLAAQTTFWWVVAVGVGDCGFGGGGAAQPMLLCNFIFCFICIFFLNILSTYVWRQQEKTRSTKQHQSRARCIRRRCGACRDDEQRKSTHKIQHTQDRCDEKQSNIFFSFYSFHSNTKTQIF